MSTFTAAATQLDLQPVVGALLTGFATRLEPSTGCHDPLMAKVLLLDDGATRLAWISCDLIGFSVADSSELRRLIAERLGVPPANVLVSCTHTHSGPSSMPFRGDLARVDPHWLGRTFHSIADAAATLPARLRRARLACATANVTGLGYNRQDGVSPIDERLVVMQLCGVDGNDVIATILNYATHPVVLGERNLLFSADYPGYATRFLEQQTGGGIAMFVLGAAGDVDPVIYRDAGRNTGTFAAAESMGRKLAEAAVRALADAEARTDVRISTAETHADLPLDPPPSRDELAALKAQLLARRGPPHVFPASNEGKWAIFELAWLDDLERAMRRDAVPPTIRANMTTVRLGGLDIVTFPFEMYSRIGLDIRRQLAPRPVLIAGYTNGLIGYVPTNVAKDQGGYGPSSSHRFFPELLTPIGYDADAGVVRAATESLRALP